MFSPDGTLISASAAPHCGATTTTTTKKKKKQKERKKNERKTEKKGKKCNSLPDRIYKYAPEQ